MLAFNARDVHPPLFYVLLKGWLTVSGLHYLTAKYLAIAASLPALPLLYQIGRRLTGAWTSLAAVLLLAISPAALLLAPTVRDFGLGLTLSLATAVLALELTARRHFPARRHAGLLLLFTLLTAAALLTWYFHLFFLVAEALFLFLSSRRISAGYLSLAAGSLLALPWYAYVLPHITSKLERGTTTFGSAPRVPGATDLASGLTRAVLGQPWSVLTAAALAGWLVALGVGLASLLLAGPQHQQTPNPPTASPRPLSPARLLMLLLFLLGILEVAATTLRWSDIGSLDRYILPLLPFAAILQARTAFGPVLFLRILSLGGLLLAVAAQSLWFHTLLSSPPIDWSHDAALAYVAAHAQRGDAILFNDRARRGRYVLDGGALKAAVIHSAGQAYLADSATAANRTAADLAVGAKRIWLLETAPSVNVAQTALAEHAYGLPVLAIEGSDVQLFFTRDAAPLQPVGQTLGGIISLDAAGVPSTATPGAAFPVLLDWRDIQPTSTSYSVFLHVVGPTGANVAQHDGPPQLGLSPTNTWHAGQTVTDRFSVQLPAGLPRGDYDLQVGLYFGPTRLALPDGANVINLGSLRVG